MKTRNPRSMSRTYVSPSTTRRSEAAYVYGAWVMATIGLRSGRDRFLDLLRGLVDCVVLHVLHRELDDQARDAFREMKRPGQFVEHPIAPQRVVGEFLG